MSTYDLLGVDKSNRLPPAVVTAAADLMLKAATAIAIRNAIGAASTSDVDARIAALVAASPSTLDTLDELANALGDDPNFATTITNLIAQKAPLASPTFTGLATLAALKITGGTPGVGKVWTGTDANGAGGWQTPSGQAGRGFTPRGGWTANTAYAVDDIVTNNGNTYRVATAHTSPATFSTTNLELWAARGLPGAAGSGALGAINVKSYGAVGDGSNDDTSAIAQAYQACVDAAILGHPKALYFPSGWYRVTGLPAFQTYSTILGDGQRATTILYEGTGTLCTLANRQEITFRGLGFWATGAGSTTLDLSACFSIYFDDFCARGQHTRDSGTTYRTQVGVNIRDNTGNCQFHHFNFNNLGIGLRTRTIQNHLTQGKFAYCYTSILGTGGNANAGLNLHQVEFDSSKDATTTRCHLDIDGSANTWALNEVWFEGGNQAMIVGRAGVGGPSSFSMAQSKVAGRATYAEFQHATMITLDATEFNPDQETPSGTAELSINAQYCPIGRASMLMTTTAGRNNQIPRSFFPNSWIVEDKAGIRATVVAP